MADTRVTVLRFEAATMRLAMLEKGTVTRARADFDCWQWLEIIALTPFIFFAVPDRSRSFG